MKIMLVYGTRPELIKLAPVIKELQRRNADLLIVNTGQHRELIYPLQDSFCVYPHYDLSVMCPGQSLTSLSSKLFDRITRLIGGVDYVVVQGDTSTAFIAALVAFYNKIPIGHVEAGLRTYNTDPYPEEGHRRMISTMATHHFAPTSRAARNLFNEGINTGNIYVVGNTGIDTLMHVSDIG
jgi:UDP-N-acetylglucosamine 2-epimerase (non-hydrolysing)